MKILLIEDHATLAEISCSQLREIYGHEVAHAVSGGEAFAALETFEPDLVLLDIHLPDMTGYEIAERLRAQPKWSGVVVIALTAFGSEVHSDLAAKVGIDAYFRKPMDFKLLPTIRRSAAPGVKPQA